MFLLKKIIINKLNKEQSNIERDIVAIDGNIKKCKELLEMSPGTIRTIEKEIENKTKYENQLSSLKDNKTQIINDFLKIVQLNAASMSIFIFILALLYWGILYYLILKIEDLFTIINFSILSDNAVVISSILFILINLISIYASLYLITIFNVNSVVSMIIKDEVDGEELSFDTSTKSFISFMLTTITSVVVCILTFIVSAIYDFLHRSEAVGLFAILIIISIIIVFAVSIIASFKIKNFKIKRN